jgi:hypothetical protein
MLKRIIPLVIFLLALSPQASFPAWYFSSENLQNIIQLPDGEYNFSLDNMQCNVSRINYNKVSATETVEFRTMGCTLAQDLYVEVSVTCDLPSEQANSLFIRTKGGDYNPSLICAPKK